MEWLKALFGQTEDGQPEALTLEQLTQKIEASKDKLQIVNLKDGGYVAKDKFDSKVTTMTTENEGLKAQLASANETIESYKGMDVEAIKHSAEEWKQKYETDTAALNEKLAMQERSHQTDMFISGYQFASKAAKVGIMAEFERQNFQLKDGSFQGAAEWMTKQMEEDPTSFVIEKPDDVPPDNDPNNGGNQQQQTQPTKPNFVAPTSNGSGPTDTQKQSLFGYDFKGVRKKPGQEN